MSQFDPLQQAAQRPGQSSVLPPPPPIELKPIASWVWGSAAILVVTLAAGSLFFVKRMRSQSHQADSAVNALHSKMTAGDDAGILADADPNYRTAVTDETSNGFFDNVRTRLGAPRSSRQIDSDYSKDDNLGDFLTLRYHTSFDKGTGQEIICFHKLNGAWKLAAYNIESPLLQARKPLTGLKPK